MNNLLSKQRRLKQRQTRIRARVHGTKARPRLSLTFSNKHIIAQLIDDDAAKTLVYVSTTVEKLPSNLSEQAKWLGKEIANRAVSAKFKQVVLDRRGKPYQGRVSVFAQAARENGLEF